MKDFLQLKNIKIIIAIFILLTSFIFLSQKQTVSIGFIPDPPPLPDDPPPLPTPTPPPQYCNRTCPSSPCPGGYFCDKCTGRCEKESGGGGGGGGICDGRCSGSYTEDEIWCDTGTCAPYEHIGSCVGVATLKCRKRGAAKSCSGLSQQDCKIKGCTWTAGNICVTGCTKTCGGGTCNNVCGQQISCNTQACPTAIPTLTTTLTPTPTTSPVNTPTNVPGCDCNASSECASVCPVNQTANKFSDITYANPIKCSREASIAGPTPIANDKKTYCQRPLRPKGDADGNNVVDQNDYVVYLRAVLGAPIAASANPDFNGDGLISPADLVIWKRSTP